VQHKFTKRQITSKRLAARTAKPFKSGTIYSGSLSFSNWYPPEHKVIFERLTWGNISGQLMHLKQSLAFSRVMPCRLRSLSFVESSWASFRVQSSETLTRDPSPPRSNGKKLLKHEASTGLLANKVSTVYAVDSTTTVAEPTQLTT